MAIYVPDTKTLRWVIISPIRKNRPESSHSDKTPPHLCPFCPGNEHLTPPEVSSKLSVESTWSVRVVPNKYPITDIHEVIIHSPSHTQDIAELDQQAVEQLFTMYQQRFITYEQTGQVIIFCNHGKEGGASMAHPHSQLVVVPTQVPFDELSKEPIRNIVTESEFFTVYCPDFSQWPFETWITPRSMHSFAQSSKEEIQEASILLPQLIRAVGEIFETSFKHALASDTFCYNYYIADGNDYFIRLIPRFIYRAGFEMGTGLSVNITEPKEAAREIIKKIEIRK